jgi:recombination protein RecA
MGDERIGQGVNSVKEYLIANPDIAEEVEAKVRENLLKATAVQPKGPAKAAERPIKVDADDFDDED